MKKQYVEIRRPDSHGMKYVCVSDLKSFSLQDEYDGAEPGEVLHLTLVELTDEELLALGDFEGW
jgi:hypothetical protein